MSIKLQHYIYLHGFASSPLSKKAQYFHKYFIEANLQLNILDLNENDFSHLTLSRQLKQVKNSFPYKDIPVTIIGSSFGGLTAAWLGEKYPQVTRLILLAPAFDFLKHLLFSLGNIQVKQWQKEGYLSIYHYGEKQNIPLNYQFITDLMNYKESQLKRSIPTLIIHGKNDETIPIKSSRDYVQTRDYVKLIEFDSDHSLIDKIPQIWKLIQEFIAY